MKLDQKRVKTILKKRGMSPEQIAWEIDCEQNKVWQALQGEAASSYLCHMIAAVLNVRLDWLCGQQHRMRMDYATLSQAHALIMLEIDARQTALAGLFKQHLQGREEKMPQILALHEKAERLLGLEEKIRHRKSVKEKRILAQKRKRAREQSEKNVAQAEREEI